MINVIQHGVRYVYIPEWTNETLSDLPTLAAALGDPSIEGEHSVHFELARTTPRQMYRLPTAAHMPHILSLLHRVEFTYAAAGGTRSSSRPPAAPRCAAR